MGFRSFHKTNSISTWQAAYLAASNFLWSLSPPDSFVKEWFSVPNSCSAWQSAAFSRRPISPAATDMPLQCTVVSRTPQWTALPNTKYQDGFLVSSRGHISTKFFYIIAVPSPIRLGSHFWEMRVLHWVVYLSHRVSDCFLNPLFLHLDFSLLFYLPILPLFILNFSYSNNHVILSFERTQNEWYDDLKRFLCESDNPITSHRSLHVKFGPVCVLKRTTVWRDGLVISDFSCCVCVLQLPVTLDLCRVWFWIRHLIFISSILQSIPLCCLYYKERTNHCKNYIANYPKEDKGTCHNMLQKHYCKSICRFQIKYIACLKQGKILDL